MKNILYYKFVKIGNVQGFRDEHYELCKSLGLHGKVLVAEEGINGCLSGDDFKIEEYKKIMWKDPRFSDIEFKESTVGGHTFRRLFVRIRPEIITFKQPKTSAENAGRYIEPEELDLLYKSGEEFYIIDARNGYESAIGKFENAVTTGIGAFSQWPEAVKELENLKDKKIVLYCTGGIRCEKASAYMLEQGFRDVSQVHGGIIRYGERSGGRHWKGKCFVFDERISVDIGNGTNCEPISSCYSCGNKEHRYHNCAVKSCDRMFIGCEKCIKELDKCCSGRCNGLIKLKQKL